jgi:hypothetical protein
MVKSLMLVAFIAAITLQSSIVPAKTLSPQVEACLAFQCAIPLDECSKDLACMEELRCISEVTNPAAISQCVKFAETHLLVLQVTNCVEMCRRTTH